MAKKVLIVEDSRFQAEALAGELSGLGCETSIAVDGKEALKKLTQDTELVVLDTKLPDTDGFKLCKEIKAKRPQGLSIVITTAHVDAVDAVKARKSGADDYAVKTEDYGHLVDVIKKYL